MPELTSEQVRLLLSLQGYEVPETDLVEITARFNALVDGLSQFEQFGPLDKEPWPNLLPFGDTDD